MDKSVTEWQIMFTMTSGLEDFYTENEDEYNEKFQDLIDSGDLQYVEQCVRKDYVWNEELEDWDEDWVEVLYDAENYDDYKDTQRDSVTNEYKYKVSSYYDMKYLGLEDTFYTNEWSEVEDEAHKKLMQGNYVLIQNLITGKEIKLNPDEYDETFDGEFLVKPDQLEESKDTNNAYYEKADEWWEKNGERAVKYVSNETPEAVVNLFGYGNKDDNAAWDMYVSSTAKSIALELYNFLGPEEFEKVLDEYEKNLNESYVSYEEPYNGKKLSKAQWKKIYDKDIDKKEWSDFDSWWYDMTEKDKLIVKEDYGLDLYPEIEKKVKEMISSNKSKSDIEDYIVGQRQAYSIDKNEEEKLKALLKESKETDRQLRTNYKKAMERELEKVQDAIANAGPGDISGLEDRRDFLMDKLDQIDSDLEKKEESIDVTIDDVKDMFNNLPDNIKSYLENTDNVPTKEIEGTLWFDITQEEKEQLEQFVNYIDTISEDVWRKWDEKTKLNMSSYANNADRICRNCTLKLESKNIKTESKDNKVEVEHYHLEDMGGHTMAVFGSLKDGRYFAGNEELMTIYDEDIWPQYCEDDPDTTMWEKEHTLLSTSRYDTNKENLQTYYDIISQTSFFDDEDLKWFKEHLGLDNNDVADKKEESLTQAQKRDAQHIKEYAKMKGKSVTDLDIEQAMREWLGLTPNEYKKLVKSLKTESKKVEEQTHKGLQEEIEINIDDAIYDYLIKDGYETEETAKEFIKDYVVVKTWYEDMTSASSAEILEKYLAVEVRAELDYDDLSTLSNCLDKVVQKYDASSYFDFITGGTIRAYIQIDNTKLTENENSKKTETANEVEDYEPYYVKEFNENGTDIDTIGFETEQEAIDYARSNLKKNPNWEYAVYETETDECLYVFDNKEESKKVTETKKSNKQDKVNQLFKDEYDGKFQRFVDEAFEMIGYKKDVVREFEDLWGDIVQSFNAEDYSEDDFKEIQNDLKSCKLSIDKGLAKLNDNDVCGIIDTQGTVWEDLVDLASVDDVLAYLSGEYDDYLEESKQLNEGSKSVDRNSALLDLFNELYDGMGDMYAEDEWAEILASDYDLDSENMEADKIILTALNKMDDTAFKNEVDNFIVGLVENDGVEYLKDTLHIYPRNLKHIIQCFNAIKPYASEPDKIDEAIEELQSANLDLRLTAEEFQRYLHDNYKPWEVLGTTTGPRTYVNLFEVPTDYDIVGADYFNYANRPSDMLDHIGYGWKQDGDKIVADLIGFAHSIKGSVARYDQAPVKYGYSATIDSSNKEEKFKEMANALMSKAKEIKEKYKLGESKKTEAEVKSKITKYTNDMWRNNKSNMLINPEEESIGRLWKVKLPLFTTDYISKSPTYYVYAESKSNALGKVVGFIQNHSKGPFDLLKDFDSMERYIHRKYSDEYEEYAGLNTTEKEIDKKEYIPTELEFALEKGFIPVVDEPSAEYDCYVNGNGMVIEEVSTDILQEAKDLYGEWIDLLDKIPADKLEDYKIEYDLYDEQLNGDEKPTEMILPKLIAGAKKYIKKNVTETKITESLDIYGMSEDDLIDMENKLNRYVKRNHINYPVERVKIRTNRGAEDYVGVIVDVTGTKYVISPKVMYAGVYLSNSPMRNCNWVITHLDSGVCASPKEYSSLEDAINDVKRVDDFLQNGKFKDELVTRTKEMQDILGNKMTEAVNIEKEKEKVADDIQTAGVKDVIDTEKELEDGIKKEVYQFAKQQGLDLEKLRKQGVELETIADTIDKVIGDMVSKTAIEFMDQTNQEINWDFEIVGNDIKIVWEKK